MTTLKNKSDNRIKSISFTDDMIAAELMDGRIISVPLIYYPRLFNATENQRLDWRISGGGYGIHWEEIDEDLSSEGLLNGEPAPTRHFSIV